MTYLVFVLLVVVGSALAIVLLAAYLLLRRSVVVRIERREARHRATVEPHVVAWVAATRPDTREAAERALRALHRRSERNAASLAFARVLGVVGGRRHVDGLRIFDELGLLDRLERRLRSWSASRRARACELTGSLAHPALVAELARRLHDDHPEVRIAAARALGRTRLLDAAAPLAGLLHGGQVARGTTFHAILELGPAGAGTFGDALADGDPDVRAIACLGIGRANRDAAAASGVGLDRLQLAAADDVAEVREAASIALGASGDGRAAPVLERGLEDLDARVRRASAQSLQSLGDRRSRAPLERALDDLDRETALRAANALLAIDDRAERGAGSAQPDHWALRHARATRHRSVRG
jgi:HEAT repeat protein